MVLIRNLAERPAAGTTGSINSRTVARAELTLPPCDVTTPISDNNGHPQAHLLGIPKELLNKIIILATAIPLPLSKDEEKATNDALGIQTNLSSPALARTCSALETAVLSTYYGQNTYSFKSASEAAAWLQRFRYRQAYETPVRSISFPVATIETKHKGHDSARSLARLQYYTKHGHPVTKRFLMRLEEGSNKLMVFQVVEAARSSSMCRHCFRVINDQVEDINDLCEDSAGADALACEKLLILACWLDDWEKVFTLRGGDEAVAQCRSCGQWFAWHRQVRDSSLSSCIPS